MCRRLHTYFFYLEKQLDTKDGLSSANQIIHDQNQTIISQAGTISLLEKMVREESEAKYKAWKKLAEVKELNSLT